MTRRWRQLQQAVSSPLLETTIKGATHVIINISGDISLMDANDAASYVQELTGEDSNIIFGAMYDDSVADYARITVIATGLSASGSQIHTIWQQKQYNTIRCSQTGSRHCRDNPDTAADYEHAEFQSAEYAEYTDIYKQSTVKHCTEERHPDSGFP